MKQNFYILTGGPGSGKTTILNGLRDRGFTCVEEVGRLLIQEQLKIGGNAVHWGDQKAFRDLMLSRSMYLYDQMRLQEDVVFFDRGIPELIGYCALIGCEVPPYLQKAVEEYSYNKSVFIMPPWQEIYQNDPERKQDFQEAIDTYHCVANAYTDTGYSLIEVPKASVEERITFILNTVS
jgi:predicted ATPase